MEQRCDHGFLRSVVPCSTCDDGQYRFQKGDALGETKRMTSLGEKIAGIVVTKEYDKALIQAQCGCGKLYDTYRSTVTGCVRRRKLARCQACISAIRAEAQRQRGIRGRLSRDQSRQQQLREKQGVAA